MRRRCALLAVLVAASGLTAVVLSPPASAAVSHSRITAPANGTHYRVTDTHPSTTTVPVTGTTDGTTGDAVDIRCYENAYSWDFVQNGVPVAADGTFSTTMQKGSPYGTCVLRAVPAGYASGSNLRNYVGPKVTTEWNTSDTVTSGPNIGKVFDYYVLFQSGKAMNDYVSATHGGLWDTRLQYSDGSASNYLWFGNAALRGNEGTRSYLKVDGHNAYGPYSAHSFFPNNPGLRQLSYTATRNAKTGTTTIHESDPIMICPSDTFPPTALSCPRFKSAGVRLDRTLVTNDSGRQVHITDVWRSTNRRAHVLSAHYDQEIQGSDPSPPGSSSPVGLKLPWLGGFKIFTTDRVYQGTKTAPRSLFVRDDNTAPQGNTAYPRGGLSFDVGPRTVHRPSNSQFTLRDEGIKVPAKGKRVVREDFVIGTTDTEVARKAAANARRMR